MSDKTFLLDGKGLWLEVRRKAATGGGVLLLDRDGVVNIDTGYVHDPAAVTLVPDIAPMIARCNRAGIRVAIVTNQSGIARRLYGWQDFAAVQTRIDALLAASNAKIDAVFACSYHAEGAGELRVADHFWRKPQPGMLLAALSAFGATPARCAMIGDRESDMMAADAAGIELRFLLTSQPRTPVKLARIIASPLDALPLLLEAQRVPTAARLTSGGLLPT